MFAYYFWNFERSRSLNANLLRWMSTTWRRRSASSGQCRNNEWRRCLLSIWEKPAETRWAKVSSLDLVPYPCISFRGIFELVNLHNPLYCMPIGSSARSSEEDHEDRRECAETGTFSNLEYPILKIQGWSGDRSCIDVTSIWYRCTKIYTWICILKIIL